MDQREQEQRPVRREYGSSTAADSIGQARRVIDQLEARINDARRVPMSKTLSIVDTGELIDLIGQLRIVLPHTVVQAQAILEQQKQILGDAKAEVAYYLVPLYNSVQCMIGIFSFDFQPLNVAVCVIANLAYAGVGVLALQCMFDSERLMFAR